MLAKENIRAFLKEVNHDFGTTVLLTTHDLSNIEELCRRLMIIDQGRILFDGPLEELKKMLWRRNQIRFELKDRQQAVVLEALSLPNVEMELSCRALFDRGERTAGEVIRGVVAAVDVRDIFIEEESIEKIVKRVYTGRSIPDFERSRV